jgi:hypothetical protein
MPDDLGDRSHRLFGRQYRLALWAAIAERQAGEEFTNGQLATELRLTTGAVSKELAALVAVGLLTAGKRSGTKPYQRVESGFWEGCAALHREWKVGDESPGRVIPIR